ncbi:MAG: phosphotransferase [candidate division Zixibacteria bacterium]
MTPEIIALFTDTIQSEAAKRFGLESDNIKVLDGFENFVCQCQKDGKPFILRISHPSHRSEDQISAELHWVNYLSENNVSVCTPILSTDGSLTESIPGDSCDFVAVAFEKAKGGIVRRNDQTDAMAANRGSVIGRIHALTKDYRPISDSIKRLHWYEDSDFTRFDHYLPDSDSHIKDKIHNLIAELRSIPTDRENYGLIHMDAHTGNMFFDGDQSTLFDFDDCTYDFFVSDIAIPLFYMVLFLPEEYDRTEFALNFLKHYMAGYRKENDLDERLLRYVPLILKRRQMILFVAIHRGMDMNNLDEWCTNYLKEARESIENDIPVLDIDFSKLRLHA